MKNKKTYLILAVVISLGFLSNQFVIGQEYNYSELLISSASYEWQVSKLEIVGSISTSFLNFNDTLLGVGDKFSINITQNIDVLANGSINEVDDISNGWAEFYLNGEFKSDNITDIGFLELDWMSWSDGELFFLQPTTYTNETGTYNHFELLQNDFEQINSDTKGELSYENFYSNMHLIVKQSSKLTSKTWTIKYSSKLTYIEEDFTGLGGWSKDDDTVTREIEIRFNVESGFVTYLSYYYNSHSVSETNGLMTTDDDIIDLQIESTQLPTGAPYNWSFAVISLFVLGLVAYRKRRK